MSKSSNEEFRALLAACGWNGSEAARRLGVSAAQISRWRSDENQVTEQALRFMRHLAADELPAHRDRALRESGPEYRTGASAPAAIAPRQIAEAGRRLRALAAANEERHLRAQEEIQRCVDLLSALERGTHDPKPEAEA